VTVPRKPVPAAAGALGTGGAILLAGALLLAGPWVAGAPAGTDLSVFRKDGADEGQMSLDRYECHLQAVLTAGDPARRPASTPAGPPLPVAERSFQGQKMLKEQEKVDRWKQQNRYNQAVRSCLEGRGYQVLEDGGSPPAKDARP